MWDILILFWINYNTARKGETLLRQKSLIRFPKLADHYTVYEDDKWGFIDKQGKPVILSFYNHVGDFSSGLATVLKEREKVRCSQPY